MSKEEIRKICQACKHPGKDCCKGDCPFTPTPEERWRGDVLMELAGINAALHTIADKDKHDWLSAVGVVGGIIVGIIIGSGVL